jgi:pyrroloquinoline quinone biosynthesis protein E
MSSHPEKNHSDKNVAPVALALIVELTHRCPLHCVYCSNPLELQARERELKTEVWARVFKEAGEMGVLQLHLTGGEPTAREDIVELIRHGRENKLYINLITSGIGITSEKLKLYCDAGLDHIQLSFQDSEEKTANEFAGTKAHLAKIATAKLIKQFPLAFTMNIVVHKNNLSRLAEMIALGESLGVDRMEIAHVQYYGWAFKNRAALLPTRSQVKESVELIHATKARLKDKMRIDFVVPDYYAKFPKPCMGGWGRTSLLVDPAGRVMPCHSAMVIPGLEFENVVEKSLSEIWKNSSAFEKFRGESWMQEPCSSCDRRAKDFGGCRCQAFMLAGDAASTDPVCSLAPTRKQTDEMVAAITEGSGSATGSPTAWSYRKMR